MVKKAKKNFKKTDILLHEFVPKHVIMSKEEVDQLLDAYHIELVDLPRISIDDPAVQMIGGQLNDVIHIFRQSRTSAGISDYYRFVIKLT